MGKLSIAVYIVFTVILMFMGAFVMWPAPVGIAAFSIVIGVLLFTKHKKTKYRVIFGLFVVLILTSITVHWPFVYSLPIKGYVRDRNTGEPVSNAIFECKWVKYSGNVGGREGRDFGQSYAVTDKGGRYRLPGKLTFHPFTLGPERHITLRHPLYTVSKFYPGPYLEDELQVFRIGSITKDFVLLKLEDNYKNGLKGVDGTGFTATVDGNIYYAKLARDLGVNMDWEKIFRKWDEMAKPYNGYTQLAKDRIKTLNEGR